VLVVARESQVVSITFWTMGSLGSATWRSLAVIGPLVALGVVASWTLARPLDALLLGEREAGHLGVDVRGLRLRVVVVAAVLTGAAVSSAGILSFVGLVVPHLIRMVWGPAHRFLLPASAVLGGALLVLADTASRTVWAPTELPIGTLTTLLGGPFFLVLLRREARWLS
jgi:iron complex transport system permease protein